MSLVVKEAVRWTQERWTGVQSTSSFTLQVASCELLWWLTSSMDLDLINPDRNKTISSASGIPPNCQSRCRLLWRRRRRGCSPAPPLPLLYRWHPARLLWWLTSSSLQWLTLHSKPSSFLHNWALHHQDHHLSYATWRLNQCSHNVGNDLRPCGEIGRCKVMCGLLSIFHVHLKKIQQVVRIP